MFGIGDAQTAQEFAATQEWMRLYCERFSVVAPEAFSDLLAIVPAIQHLKGEFHEEDLREPLLKAVSGSVIEWLEKFQMKDTWVAEVATSTLLSAVTNPESPPTSLVHVSSLMEGTKSDGTRE